MERFTISLLQFALWMLLAFPSAALARGNASADSGLPEVASQREGTRSPHGALSIPCENCHTSAGWRPIRAVPEFDHSKTKYPLRGLHEKVQCTACHVKPVFTDVGKNCADCHADIHRRQMGSDCAQCHTVQGWNIAPQQVKDHQNRFPLLGAHAAVECDACHVGAAAGQFLGLRTECDSCHLKDWQNTTNPNHPKAGPAFAAGNCQGCHLFDSWLGAKFDHSTTGFLLTNGHANVPCASCHINNNYNLTIAPTDCGNAGCHLTTWQQTNNPVHSNAGPAFAVANCSGCHNTISWNTSTFDHSTTGFLLTNGHANVPCASCHINNNYNLTIAPTDCGNAGCHLTTWQQTNNPVHSTSGAAFGAANCANCHTTKGWDAASFDHSITGFPLVGTHMSPSPTPCASCHINNNYSLNSADCLTCHTPAWNSTQTLGGNVPNHVASNFPSTAAACSSCHTITVWADGKFDHSTTGFPLTNSHQLAPAGKVTGCTQCHINGNYNLTIQPNDCGNSGCHLTTWQQTNNPTHSTSGAAFAVANCSVCHNTVSWTTAAFDHSTTGFALVGTHMSPTPTPCASCHINNNYTLNSADCLTCHTPDWNKTQTLGGNVPNHVASNFPTTAAACSSCHTITVWADGKFDHSTTGFALTGSHQLAPAGKVVACTDCHVGGNYTLSAANTDCYGCHQTAWNSTQTLGGAVPNHVAAGFPTSQCSTCHNTTTWATSTFDHSTTGFPLTNSHQLAPAGKVTGCAQCHINGNYSLTIQPNDCGNSGCHLTTWQQTNNPTHSSAGAPFAAANCSTCHNTITWTTATFDHSTTGWPLTGSHQLAPAGKVVACTDCHVGNNYTFTSANTDCYGCHQTAWNSTQTLGGAVPNHVAAGFPTSQCINCHNTTTWTSTWNHSSTGFALTGTHATTPCLQCHVANNYALTSGNTDCMGCHLTAWQSTQTLGGNVPNHVSANFPTTAAACSGCHTITVWADGKFDHSTTGWALTGAHQMPPAAGSKITACTDCHVGGNYTLTASNTLCYGCHLAAWTSTQTLGGSIPNHIAAGYPTTCDTCHTTTSWLGATFNHTYFPIPHHGSVCNDCHQVSTDYSSFTCINCHTTTAHQQTQTNNQHGGVGGYSYGPTTCYNCHKNGGGG